MEMDTSEPGQVLEEAPASIIARPWDVLPLMLKKNVIEYLDYKSRCHMSKTCRTSYFLSQILPIHVEDVVMTVHRCNIRLDVGSSLIISPKHFPADVIMNDFMKIFQHPKSTFAFFHVCCYDHPDAERHEEIVRPLVNEFNALPPGFFISLETFKVELPNLEIQDYLALLRRFQPGKLRRIAIQYRLKDVWDWSSITETEQWKQAKILFISHQSTLTLDHFLQFDTFFTQFDELSKENVNKVIKSFRTGIRPFGAFFRIFVGIHFQIDKILEYCNIPLINRPIAGYWNPSRPVHTARFVLPVPNQTLVVFFYDWKLEGKIVHTDNIDKEYKVKLYAE